MAWFIPLLIGLAFTVISYLITPRPKAPKPEAARDLENPTAEAGRPAAVLFGTKTIRDPNIIWYGDKSKVTYKIKA